MECVRGSGWCVCVWAVTGVMGGVCVCSDRKTYQRGGSGRFHAGPGSGGVGVGEQPVDLPQWDASSSIADLGEDDRQVTFDPKGGRGGVWGGQRCGAVRRSSALP